MRFLFLLITIGLFCPNDLLAERSSRTRTRLKKHTPSCPSSYYLDKLVIHYIDVDHGASTFIRTPDGTTVLIDGGYRSHAVYNIIPTLKECYEVESIDYIVLTHFDEDHYNGLLEIFKAFPIKKAVYDPSDRFYHREPGPSVRKYFQHANRTLKRKVPKLGTSSIKTSDGVKFTFLSVNGRVGKSGKGRKISEVFKGDRPEGANDISMGLKVEFGDFDYFNGGDMTKSIEIAISKLVGDLDFLHINHHGSDTSSAKELLQTTKPETAVISMGANHKNPDKEVLQRLNRLRSLKSLFLTSPGQVYDLGLSTRKLDSDNGDVIVLVDHNEYEIETEENVWVWETDGK